METAELVKPPEPTVSFLYPSGAVARSEVITNQIEKLLGADIKPELFAARVYCLALRAQQKILGYLNSDSFYCQVLWDDRTGLPSHPSLAADVAKCGEVFGLPAELRALLNSLSEWTVLRSEKLEGCCCSGKPRDILLDIMVNTVLRVDADWLTIKLFLGVRTNDEKHLEKHYGFKRQSRASGDINIIFIGENRMRVLNGIVVLEPTSYNLSQKEVSVAEVASIIKKAADDIAGH